LDNPSSGGIQLQGRNNTLDTPEDGVFNFKPVENFCPKISNNMHHTQSVHTVTCFGAGHHHHLQGIQLVS
jgi:hypothetical protein